MIPKLLKLVGVLLFCWPRARVSMHDIAYSMLQWFFTPTENCVEFPLIKSLILFSYFLIISYLKFQTWLILCVNEKKLCHVPVWLNNFCLAHLWPIPVHTFILLHLFIIAVATVRLSPFFLLIPDTRDCWSLTLRNVISNSWVQNLLW